MPKSRLRKETNNGVHLQEVLGVLCENFCEASRRKCPLLCICGIQGHEAATGGFRIRDEGERRPLCCNQVPLSVPVVGEMLHLAVQHPPLCVRCRKCSHSYFPVGLFVIDGTHHNGAIVPEPLHETARRIRKNFTPQH